MLELGLAVALLLVVRLKYIVPRRRTALSWPRPAARRADALLPEEMRYAALSIHWFVTNGATAVVLIVLFVGAAHAGSLCGALLHPALSRFVGGFVVIALVRNIVDFRTVWPFLYVNTRVLRASDLTPLMSRVSKSRLEVGPTLWDLAGIVSVGVFVAAAVVTAPALTPTA